jgi:dUTP pyrophosphatase
MTIKFKKLHKDAKTPANATGNDACWDLTAVSVQETSKYIEYKTGLAMEIPEDHVGLLFPRSSITKKDLILKNCVGIIDAGYRGEVTFRCITTPPHTEYYQAGDRIGQIMIIPRPFLEWQEVEELSETVRGAGGYGSTGS